MSFDDVKRIWIKLNYAPVLVVLMTIALNLLSCKASLSDGLIQADNTNIVLAPRSLYFSAQRNRSHFKMVKDPVLEKYFAPDFVWDIRNFKSISEYREMVSLLRKWNRNIILGSYASACTAVYPDKHTIPEARIWIENTKPHWLLRYKDGQPVYWSDAKNRVFLDMRLQEVRTASITIAVQRAKHHQLDAVCFDNCYWQTLPKKGFPLTRQDWTRSFEAFSAEAGERCHNEKLKCVINVVLDNALMIPQAFKAIAPSVDGLMTEMAFHPRARSNTAINKELQAYEEALKEGKIVLLIPRRKEDAAFGLRLIRPLFRKYGRIYLSVPGQVQDSQLYWQTPILPPGKLNKVLPDNKHR